MLLTRIRAGSAPVDVLSPQGFSEGAHRVVPVAVNLGIGAVALKLCRKHFELIGERFGALDERGIGR